ncbi:MAG: MerR family DNA-binding protein [Bdellovibrionaceae bacterium]|nr:MerR family DNA-binding protein [Pseudobdellovibrionaceae bacterium]
MARFGIGRNTLRLYEEMGLLSGMKRTIAGYREYTEQHLRNLKFILAAKEVGFTLNEIKELLSVFAAQRKMTCGTVSEGISQKVQEAEEQIAALQKKKEFLNQFLSTCGSKKPDTICEVVDSGFQKQACCD